MHEKYPLPVLHGTKIGSDKVLALCDGFTAAVPDLDGVPSARRQTMPMAGKIIRLGPYVWGKRLVVSGTSIRDGVIAINELKPEQQPISWLQSARKSQWPLADLWSPMR